MSGEFENSSQAGNLPQVIALCNQFDWVTQALFQFFGPCMIGHKEIKYILALTTSTHLYIDIHN